VQSRTTELLELGGLPPDRFAKRYPHELSGGQRQRVGVARALAADPPVLLMDEPFGAIDPITRDRLQLEFIRLQSEVRKTVVFVTHDIEEAVRMGDRIAILAEGGRLEQYDTPAQVLGQPATPFVASFVGADRGLKRLSVTSIELVDLEKPPTVAVGTEPAAARQAMDAADSKWAIVLGPGEQLDGWVSREDPSTVHRLEAWVSTDATLKQAFAQMLQQDAAWVAVLDDDRYVGVLTPDSLHAALRRSVSEGG
jgi:osmoprotectant transport system ATP-binding protein